MNGLELRIPPLAVVAACVLAIVALSAFVPLAHQPFPGHRALAVAMFVGGLGVAMAGVVAFMRASTTVNPMAPERARSVVTTGIYRWSRNPMYLGMAIALLGLAAWRSSLLAYAVVPLYCAYIHRFQIVPEERVLLARFGEEFARYMSRVRRWI